MRTTPTATLERERDGDVLVHCLGLEADTATTDRIARLSEAEWAGLVDGAVDQGIGPLLHDRLARSGAGDYVPTPVGRRLEQAVVGDTLQNLRMYHDLPRVLRALKEVGVRAIVLKGAYLAAAVYEDISLRPMRDVDLMIAQSDLALAEAELVELGYVRQPDWGYSHRVDLYHLPPLIKPGSVPIELHWSIESQAQPFAIDVNGLWSRARPVTIAGADALVLSPEDLLLHLCLHTACRHQYVRGLLACWDIMETIRRHGDTIDWQQVRSRARQWRVEKYVYLTLRLAREVVGAAVPLQVLAALRPVDFKSQLFELARTEILSGAPSTAPVSQNFAQMWGAMETREKAYLLLRTLVPSLATIDRMYPASSGSRWAYLNYPVRWKDLALKYGRLAWRLVRREATSVAMVEREQERAVLMNWLKPSEPGDLDAEPRHRRGMICQSI